MATYAHKTPYDDVLKKRQNDQTSIGSQYTGQSGLAQVPSGATKVASASGLGNAGIKPIGSASGVSAMPSNLVISEPKGMYTGKPTPPGYAEKKREEITKERNEYKENGVPSFSSGATTVTGVSGIGHEGRYPNVSPEGKVIAPSSSYSPYYSGEKTLPDYSGNTEKRDPNDPLGYSTYQEYLNSQNRNANANYNFNPNGMQINSPEDLAAMINYLKSTGQEDLMKAAPMDDQMRGQAAAAASQGGLTDEQKLAYAEGKHPYEINKMAPASTVEQQAAQDIINNPSKYAEQQSNYGQMAEKLMQEAQNMGPFSYDFNNDTVFKSLQNSYMQQAKRAAADASAMAAARTGGYGNSYGAVAAAQQYNNALQNLYDQVPALEQAAYDRYRNEKQDLYNQRDYYQGLENQTYNRGYTEGRDAVGDNQWQQSFDYGKEQDTKGWDWKYAEANREQGNIDTDRDIAKSQWQQTFDYGKQRDEIDDTWRESEANRQQWNIDKDRDIAKSQWQQSFDYGREQDQKGWDWKESEANRDQYNIDKEREFTEKQTGIENARYDQARQDQLDQQDIENKRYDQARLDDLNQQDIENRYRQDAFDYQKESDALDRELEMDQWNTQKGWGNSDRDLEEQQFLYDVARDRYSREFNAAVQSAELGNYDALEAMTGLDMSVARNADKLNQYLALVSKLGGYEYAAPYASEILGVDLGSLVNDYASSYSGGGSSGGGGKKSGGGSSSGGSVSSGGGSYVSNTGNANANAANKPSNVTTQSLSKEEWRKIFG